MRVLDRGGGCRVGDWNVYFNCTAKVPLYVVKNLVKCVGEARVSSVTFLVTFVCSDCEGCSCTV